MTYTDTAIIEPEELRTLLQGPEEKRPKLLDATFVLPGSSPDPRESWQKRRIDGAAFFDIDAVSDRNSPLPHMLPALEEFGRAVSALGISNDDLIVVYGQSGMVMGPARVWWTFRVFGHDRICVLNGGLPAWLQAGGTLNTAPPGKPEPGDFMPSFRPALVRGMADVKRASHENAASILDARPPERFSGKAPEPRPGMRSGHIPGSASVPCSTLVNPETGKLKSRAELEELFKDIDPGKPVIASCGSGVTACMIALALFHTGRRDVAVYDGSWSEWGREDSGMKVERA